MGVINRIISSGTFGLLDDDKKEKEPEKEPESNARRDPIDQAQVDFRRDQLAAKDRRSRIAAQKPVKRGTTGLRVNLSSTPTRTGVQVK